MTDLTKTYWDACAWLGLINQEATRYDPLSRIYETARRGGLEIWTSAFTYAEVFKKKCEAGVIASLDDESEKEISDILSQDFIKIVPVDAIIGTNARKLLRAHHVLKKPQDAIHLATALWWNLNMLHTYDGSELLPLDGALPCRDGKMLQICVPSDEIIGPLFNVVNQNEAAGK